MDSPVWLPTSRGQPARQRSSPDGRVDEARGGWRHGGARAPRPPLPPSTTGSTHQLPSHSPPAARRAHEPALGARPSSRSQAAGPGPRRTKQSVSGVGLVGGWATSGSFGPAGGAARGRRGRCGGARGGEERGRAARRRHSVPPSPWSLRPPSAPPHIPHPPSPPFFPSLPPRWTGRCKWGVCGRSSRWCSFCQGN